MVYPKKSPVFRYSMMVFWAFFPVSVFAIVGTVVPFWQRSLSGEVERTLPRKIYLVNGSHCGHNPKSLTEMLKKGDSIQKQRFTFTVEVNDEKKSFLWETVYPGLQMVALIGNALFFGWCYSDYRKRKRGQCENSDSNVKR